MIVKSNVGCSSPRGEPLVDNDRSDWTDPTTSYHGWWTFWMLMIMKRIMIMTNLSVRLQEWRRHQRQFQRQPKVEQLSQFSISRVSHCQIVTSVQKSSQPLNNYIISERPKYDCLLFQWLDQQTINLSISLSPSFSKFTLTGSKYNVCMRARKVNQPKTTMMRNQMNQMRTYVGAWKSCEQRIWRFVGGGSGSFNSKKQATIF